jgi:hypothetical protein
MMNEQGAKWLLQEMYDEGYRDIKIFGVYAYFVNPTFIENGGHFKVREHTPRIPCRLLGIAGNNKTYSIASLLGIVEWKKVPVDTQVIVNTALGERKLYFAGVGEYGVIYCFPCGSTSWSYQSGVKLWEYEDEDVRLAENGCD